MLIQRLFAIITMNVACKHMKSIDYTHCTHNMNAVSIHCSHVQAVLMLTDAVEKEKVLLLLQHSRWVEETSAVCTVCTIHSSNFVSPPASVPSTHRLNTLHCIPHVDSQEMLPPAPQSCAIIWLFRREWWLCACLRGVCMCVWWAAMLPSPLNRLAWQPWEQTLMCQDGGIARDAIISTDKQVTGTEVMLLQLVS